MKEIGNHPMTPATEGAKVVRGRSGPPGGSDELAGEAPLADRRGHRPPLPTRCWTSRACGASMLRMTAFCAMTAFSSPILDTQKVWTDGRAALSWRFFRRKRGNPSTVPRPGSGSTCGHERTSVARA